MLEVGHKTAGRLTIGASVVEDSRSIATEQDGTVPTGKLAATFRRSCKLKDAGLVLLVDIRSILASDNFLALGCFAIGGPSSSSSHALCD